MRETSSDFSPDTCVTNGDSFLRPFSLSHNQSGVPVKLLHLWLSAALIACGLCPDAQANDFSQPGGLRLLNRANLQHTTMQQPTGRSHWFRPPMDATTVFRAQSDDPVPTPPDAGVAPQPAGAGATGIDLPPPSESTTWNAFSPPLTSDPFLAPGNVQPYAPGVPVAPGYGAPGYGAPGFGGPAGIPGNGPGSYSSFGANGGRPYRFGWEQRLDTYLIPDAGVSGGGAAGDYDELGVDYDLINTTPWVPGWIMRKTAQFRWRDWDGPIGGFGLPGKGFRVGEDIEIQSAGPGPYTVSWGITPSLNSDFSRGITSKAFQLDGRGIVWWQLDPRWSLGLGAMYWDRLDNRVLPYGGLVYRDDYWEWRLTFPEAEVRLFLGNEARWSKWVYVRAKYNVEAYEIVGAGAVQAEVEIEDWQLTAGFQMDAGYYRWFIEGGIVLDREIDYAIAPDIGVDTSFISRIGVRY